WFYDLRTDMESLGKRNPLSRKHFTDFVYAYTGGISIDDVRLNYDGTVDFKKREKIKNARWRKFTREEIAAKNDSLDVGLMSGSDVNAEGADADPLLIAHEILAKLKTISDEVNAVIRELE